MEFAEILSAFGLPTDSAREELTPGTVSRVWRIRTAQRATFLLRTLQDAAQGETEWALFQHLHGRGLQERVPALLPTADGKPYLTADGEYWQLQRFLPGERPMFSEPGSAARLAETVLLLSGALADCPPAARKDLFALDATWARGRANWDALHTNISLQEAEQAVARCCSYPCRRAQVIHGDLGPWNMLENCGRLCVIDFGEARMGDAYYDLASAFAGLLNHAPTERRDGLAAEYLAAAGVDRSELKEQLELWIWRGFARCAAEGQNGMVRRLLNVRRWAEKYL